MKDQLGKKFLHLGAADHYFVMIQRNFNDWIRARNLERFGTNHHEVMIGRAEMQKFLPELVFHQTSRLPIRLCVRFTMFQNWRDTGTIVVQVGEGSDEIFAGYDGLGPI